MIDIINNISEFFNQIKEIFISFYNFCITFFKIIPEPFSEILGTFVVIILGVIIYKIMK